MAGGAAAAAAKDTFNMWVASGMRIKGLAPGQAITVPYARSAGDLPLGCVRVRVTGVSPDCKVKGLTSALLKAVGYSPHSVGIGVVQEYLGGAPPQVPLDWGRVCLCLGAAVRARARLPPVTLAH